jgi:hypothetical protein
MSIRNDPQFAPWLEHSAGFGEQSHRGIRVNGSSRVKRWVENNEIGRIVGMARESVVLNDANSICNVVCPHSRVCRAHGRSRLIGRNDVGRGPQACELNGKNTRATPEINDVLVLLARCSVQHIEQRSRTNIERT